jgi:catechol 2,3-dioxygenase-like lactoylglutathione lyase family enzyme
MEHVGIVVDDLAAATEFFVELGLELQGEGSVEGRWVDRVVGLEGVRVDYAMMQTPDGNGRLELVKFHSPSRTSTPSSPACEPAALNSSASWSATRTATGSATSAARRESSSS